jgi:hypothetical protein
MNTTRELRPEAWRDYFKALNSSHGTLLVTVEVVRDRPVPARDVRPLHAIGYDQEACELHLAVAGPGAGDGIAIRHFIADPRTIEIDGTEPLNPAGILVEDASRTRTSIRFFDRLPASEDGEVVESPCAPLAPRRRSCHVIAESRG